MTRTTKLALKRLYVYCKWGFVCLFWFAAIDYVLSKYIAAVLACLLTVEIYADPDNWKEHQLMKRNVIYLWKPKDR